MSTSSTVACTTFFDFDISAERVEAVVGDRAMPTLVSVVEKGWGATSSGAAGEGVEQGRLARIRQPHDAQALHWGQGNRVALRFSSAMSKKTNKRKIRARRKKANHGKRPNVGRR